MVNYQQMNGITLAYMGDAIYEVFIREHLISKGVVKPTHLHHTATRYVSAKAHAALYRLMQQDNILTDEEQQYFHRGRNAKSHTSAKNTDIVTYRISTGIEALFGYLYLSKQNQRIENLMNWCIEQVEIGRTMENNSDTK
ncbi:Mini-ribonuclease 3 [Periweissella beninensis]|uniref:Mini-ribonuclease 3 n=1 Tax=Periweissella beninensis TaxID=504936 RepID=A0ABT0VGT9_9LACO|nr:Mini-ribonuclease 3 [Periweissella beninensis]MBM7544609.1 ribonuclease-3 family protein [Periweissella beninensis]MCM2436876.1 Mini-ribonuclease 3 [Periweissella beninensis]